MKKRILSIFTAVTMILCLTGCQKGVDSEQANQKNGELVEMKIIDPPEDGWTLEQLNEVLYMNGQKIELPLMFSSLKEGYKIKNEQSYASTERKAGELYFNNEFIAIISYQEVNDDYEIKTLQFIPDYYKKNQNYSEYIRINGLGLNDNISDVTTYLGNDYEKNNNIIKYIIGNSEYTILMTDINDYMITIYEGVNNIS